MVFATDFDVALSEVHDGMFVGMSEYDAKSLYRRMAMRIAPDRNRDRLNEAEAALTLLNKLWELARIQLGIKDAPPVTLRTRTHAYTLGRGSPFGLVTEYTASREDGQSVQVRIARHPRDNDRIQRERTALKAFDACEDRDKKFRPYMPELLDTFKYRDEKRTEHEGNVINPPNDMMTLSQVLEILKSSQELGIVKSVSIDPKDVAWIWRRLLTAIAFAQSCGQVHGAVTPDRILLNADQHLLRLDDWVYSVPVNSKLTVIDTKYKAWYPPELISKDRSPVTSMLDVSMGAGCMLLAIDTYAPPRIIRHFQGMTRAHEIYSQHIDVEEVLRNFDSIIDDMWPRVFHHFNWKGSKE